MVKRDLTHNIIVFLKYIKVNLFRGKIEIYSPIFQEKSTT